MTVRSRFWLLAALRWLPTGDWPTRWRCPCGSPRASESCRPSCGSIGGIVPGGLVLAAAAPLFLVREAVPAGGAA